MPNFVKMMLPPAVGALLAFLVTFGLIWSQNQTPDANPASEPVLTYGDR